MSSPKNYALDDEYRLNSYMVVRAWRHTEKPLEVFVEEMEDLYEVRVVNPTTDAEEKVVDSDKTAKGAKKKAVQWMRDHPDGI